MLKRITLKGKDIVSCNVFNVWFKALTLLCTNDLISLFRVLLKAIFFCSVFVLRLALFFVLIVFFFFGFCICLFCGCSLVFSLTGPVILFECKSGLVSGSWIVLCCVSVCCGWEFIFISWGPSRCVSVSMVMSSGSFQCICMSEGVVF